MTAKHSGFWTALSNYLGTAFIFLLIALCSPGYAQTTDCYSADFSSMQPGANAVLLNVSPNYQVYIWREPCFTNKNPSATPIQYFLTSSGTPMLLLEQIVPVQGKLAYPPPQNGSNIYLTLFQSTSVYANSDQISGYTSTPSVQRIHHFGTPIAVPTTFQIWSGTSLDPCAAFIVSYDGTTTFNVPASCPSINAKQNIALQPGFYYETTRAGTAVAFNVQANGLFMGIYSYSSSGSTTQANWTVSVLNLVGADTYSGSLIQCAGGSPISAPSYIPSNCLSGQGNATLSVTTPTTAVLNVGDASGNSRTLNLQFFRF